MASPSLWLFLLPIAASHSYLVWNRLLAYLRYFQQEGYESIRFVKWVGFRSVTDPAFLLSVASVALSQRFPGVVDVCFVAGAMILATMQPDPRRSGKIPLRLTARATRILCVSFLLASLLWVWSVTTLTSLLQSAFIGSAVIFAVVPFVLLASNASLGPFERRVQRRYEAEAAHRVRVTRPHIIGITGSYGKSSTKAILAHILQFKGPTLAASGSVNTLMGVTRHIREDLVFGHQFMVVEMGAFRTGSIRRLCELAPPSAGLITSVGDMHLERFGSTDEIVRAKGELAAALPIGGLLVVNADSPGALRIARSATHCRVFLYGESSPEEVDTRLAHVEFSKHGTSFVLQTGGRALSCFTPLLGRPIIVNIAGAFTLAAAVGVDPTIIVAALRTLKPVQNRLEVVEERGITWIRDAYNSNQFGFRAALEVAAVLPVTRRFLVTPGVIELGDDQFQVNRTLSREAASVCDATVVVAETNRDAFVAGYRDAGRERNLVCLPGRTEAFRWLRDTVRSGDAVILENDLPDLYEQSAGIFWKEPRRVADTPPQAQVL